MVYAHKNSFVNIGVAMNYYLGHRIRYWNLDFEDSDYTDAKYEIEKVYKNPGFTVGFSKKIGKVSLGAAYSSHVKLEGAETYKYAHTPYADTLSLEDDFFVLHFDEEISLGIDSGSVLLYRPSNSKYDLRYELSQSDTLLILPKTELILGRYIVKLYWYSEGLKYEIDKPVNIQ